MRRALSLLVVSLTMLAGLSAVAGTAHAGPGESEFVSRTNAARTSRGLRAYTVKADLVAVARRHAARMAAKGDIYHNPNLGSEVDGWRSVGENVGVGGDVESIHEAFMNSSGHRANILDREFTEVGIGTATGANGRIYVTEIFRLPSGAPAAAPAPAPTPTRRTSPARTTPRPGVTRPAAPARAAAPARPVPAVDTAAELRTRLAAARAAARRDASGALDRAVSYHGVMAALGG